MLDCSTCLLAQNLKQKLYTPTNIVNSSFNINSLNSTNKLAESNQKTNKIDSLKAHILSDALDNAINEDQQEDEQENDIIPSMTFQLATEIMKNAIINKICIKNKNFTGQNFFNNQNV